jgi:hypothetical protein
MKSIPSLASFAVAVALLFPSGFGFQQHLIHRRHQHLLPYSDDGVAIRSKTTTVIAATSITSAQDISGQTFDLAVIGAGPVGVSAALRAARSPYHKKVVLIDAPRASGMLMDERSGEDLSLGGPTGLFSKALRDTGKRISVSSLKGMGLRDDR